MIEILIFCLFYLTITSIILIRNVFDFKKLAPYKSAIDNSPKVSICIPARNEELVIRNCIQSALAQDYRNLEVIVLNDKSTDGTQQILNEIKQQNSDINLKILPGGDRPEGWLGKNWACHQLGKEASGDYLIFIDADTWMQKKFISRLMGVVQQNKLDAVTVWPHQILVGFWEKVVIPQVYFVIHTLLPVKYTSTDPKWVPKYFRPKIRKYFAAACGQCIAINKQVYLRIGGHSAVKNKVVEDVEIARLIRSNNYSMQMLMGVDYIFCRMYQNSSDIFNGFRKNFLAGFGNNYLLFLIAGILHFVVYLLPIALLIVAIKSNDNYQLYLSLAVIGIYSGQRLVVDLQNRWNPLFSLTHFLGVIWFQILSLFVVTDRVLKRTVKWKDRDVKV
jgi:chlorobactene glucosyltransferase